MSSAGVGRAGCLYALPVGTSTAGAASAGRKVRLACARLRVGLPEHEYACGRIRIRAGF